MFFVKAICKWVHRRARHCRRWDSFALSMPVAKLNGLLSVQHCLIQNFQFFSSSCMDYANFNWKTATPALAAPNFTEFGFGLVRAPEELTVALREGVMGAYERGEAKLEHDVEVIEGPRCRFVQRPDLTKRVRVHWAGLHCVEFLVIWSILFLWIFYVGFARTPELHRDLGWNASYSR